MSRIRDLLKTECVTPIKSSDQLLEVINGMILNPNKYEVLIFSAPLDARYNIAVTGENNTRYVDSVNFRFNAPSQLTSEVISKSKALVLDDEVSNKMIFNIDWDKNASAEVLVTNFTGISIPCKKIGSLAGIKLDLVTEKLESVILYRDWLYSVKE